MYTYLSPKWGYPNDRLITGKTWYCAPAAAGTGDGRSWTNACTLATALASATAGEVIVCKQGTHTPGSNRGDYFTFVDGVNIYGGFAGDEYRLSARHGTTTTLSGEIGTAAADDNCYIVAVGASCDIYDLTISGSYNNSGDIEETPEFQQGGGLHGACTNMVRITFSGNFSNGYGAGLYNDPSDEGGIAAFSLYDCEFDTNEGSTSGLYYQNSTATITSTNFTDGTGGALYAGTSAVLTLMGGTISGNDDLLTHGGGVYFAGTSCAISGVTFDGNTTATPAGYGGAVYIKSTASAGTVSGCTFSNNTSTDLGGAVNVNKSGWTFTDCLFDSNTCSSTGNSGGAVRTVATTGFLCGFTDCVFTKNRAGTELNGGFGGGIHGRCQVTNCLFVTNYGGTGGAIHGHAQVSKCTMYGNVALVEGGGYGGGATAAGKTIIDSLIYGNTAPSSADILVQADTTVTYTASSQDLSSESETNVQLSEDPYTDSTDPIGTDLTWWTSDDGLRIPAGSALLTASSTGGEIGAYAE